MKAKTHPQYFEDLKIVCSCGNIIIAGSTRKELKTEICSGCHPFYTGQQKLIDTAGRVDKFMAKVKKAQQIKAKEEKVIDEELEEILETEEEKTPEPEQTGEEAGKEEGEEANAPAKKTATKTTKTPRTNSASKKTATKKSPAKKK